MGVGVDTFGLTVGTLWYYILLGLSLTFVESLRYTLFCRGLHCINGVGVFCLFFSSKGFLHYPFFLFFPPSLSDIQLYSRVMLGGIP